MALANLGEFATGLALISALPDDMRGILKGFQIEYLKKARGELKATSKVSQITSTEKQDLEVLGEITDASGAIVTKVKALWRVDKNKKA
jgi:acyl-coenzyme A thioesterase PaaI-like protein